VGVGAKHEGTKRPHQIRHPECAESQKQRGCRVGSRKKQLGNGDGEIAVDEDVVPFERITDRGGGKDLERTGLVRRFRRDGGCRHVSPRSAPVAARRPEGCRERGVETRWRAYAISTTLPAHENR